MKLLKIHPDSPQQRLLEEVVTCLKKGGVIIYPTDTVYAIGCDMLNHKAIERVCKLKGMKPEKANLSIICNDLSHLSEFCKQLDNSTFKLMKKTLPGPYTFILKASGKVPKLLHHKKKTIGVRIPDNKIALAIAELLGNPIITTSLKIDDDILEYPTDPEIIFTDCAKGVDLVIDGGFGNVIGSSVLDATDTDILVVREGLGDVSFLD
jgi:tRNA threonylcarbamoyl adenosine modification protein (Sua5/YciO/YrdC/YwlC family)